MLPVLVTLGMLAAAWYVLITRPQRANQHRHAGIVGQLKAGDHVMTVGGIYGRVETVEGNSVVVEIAPGMSTRVATDGIARIVAADAAPAMPAPQAAPPQHAAPPQGYPQHYVPQPMQQPIVVQYHPQHLAPESGQQVMFRANAAPYVAAPQPTPVFAPQLWNAPGSDLHGQLPQQQPMYQPPAAQQQAYPSHVMAVGQTSRGRSSAPSGMGTAARVEGELSQAFDRARQEREELAREYRRITAPLVSDDSPAQPVMHHAQSTVPQPHAGAPLFVGHGQSTGQPLARYPEPAQLPTVTTMPRAGIAVAPVEAAFDTAPNPFYRPAPYAPRPATSAS